MKSSKLLIIAFLVFALMVTGLYIHWIFKQKKPMNILVVNKTVPHKGLEEHKSLFWVFNDLRITKANKKPYRPEKDYFGFFPLKTKKDKEYYIKNIRLTDLDSLVANSDAFFCVDAYGVFYADWYKGLSNSDNSTLIYGGLNQNDYYLLRRMKDEGKLVVMEYDALGPPTNPLIRYKTQDLFDFTWTGWRAKYFSSLDQGEGQVPQWIISKYNAENEKPWPFKNAGIVYHNVNGNLVVLESTIHLSNPLPEVSTKLDFINKFDLPNKIAYTGWFNIIETSEVNQTIADINVYPNSMGIKKLNKAGIPLSSPFIIHHYLDYLFYYFAGDVSDVGVPYYTYPFVVNKKMERLFYSKDADDPKKFFWAYYKNIMAGILNNYYDIYVKEK